MKNKTKGIIFFLIFLIYYILFQITVKYIPKIIQIILIIIGTFLFWTFIYWLFKNVKFLKNILLRIKGIGIVFKYIGFVFSIYGFGTALMYLFKHGQTGAEFWIGIVSGIVGIPLFFIIGSILSKFERSSWYERKPEWFQIGFFLGLVVSLVIILIGFGVVIFSQFTPKPIPFFQDLGSVAILFILVFIIFFIIGSVIGLLFKIPQKVSELLSK